MKISDEKLQKTINFTPHPGQLSILECAEREIVICAGRRFGKSAICAYFALKELLQPNKKVWIVAPSYDLTQKVFEYVVKWYLKAHPSQSGGISYRPIPRIRTPWGSILEGKSTENPTGLLGEEVDLEIIDEASRIPRHIYDTYLYPVTSSRQGRMLIISTPFGKNWFYERWLKAKEKSAAFQFESRDNPTFPRDEWENAKERVPEAVFRQEYMATFLEDGASVFRGILECVKPKAEVYEDARGDRRYVVGVDLGKINDFTVLNVIDTYSHKTVAWERFKEIDYNLQKVRILALANRYNRARIIIDSTGVGDPVVDDLKRSQLIVDDIKLSNKSKQQIIEKLSLFIEQKGIIIPDEAVLIDELSAYGYQLTDSGKIRFGAPLGLHDDCVIALALAVWGLTTPERKKEQNVFFNAKKKSTTHFQYN